MLAEVLTHSAVLWLRLKIRAAFLRVCIRFYPCKCHKYRGVISIYTYNQLKKSGRFKMFQVDQGYAAVIFAQIITWTRISYLGPRWHKHKLIKSNPLRYKQLDFSLPLRLLRAGRWIVFIFFYIVGYQILVKNRKQILYNSKNIFR